MSPQPDPAATYQRYETIFAGRDAPFAFVDLDALRSNASWMLANSGGLPIRVASKSIRCLTLLRRCLDLDGRYRGVLSFTLPEALHLSSEGFDDIFVGYPTADLGALGDLARLARERPDDHPALMVDSPAQLDLIEAAGASAEAPVAVAIDIDPSWWVAGGRVKIGPKRSPIRTPAQAGALAREIRERSAVKLVGAMAYEGHVAGVGDAAPGKPLRSTAIRMMQGRSMAELGRRLPDVVAAIRAEAPDGLRWVNGGGTGSLARTAALGVATELTAGSGFYAPGLFDAYRALELTPAAFFCLPVVRKPSAATATALGGGYVASGAPGADRLPAPQFPPGLLYDRDEAAGEVQTPLHGRAAAALGVGDRVYMRHAKAGELCERFDSLLLVEGNAVVDEAPTYRGAGLTFL